MADTQQPVDQQVTKTPASTQQPVEQQLIAKRVAKENFTPDPSSNVMNYAKFTAVMAGSIALKKYLEDRKILPDSV